MPDITGLLPKFKVNRPLTRQEKNDRLDQHTRIDKRLFDNFSVIELNSTYLETTDKWFEARGWFVSASTLCILILGGFWSITVGVEIFNALFNPAGMSKVDPVFVVIMSAIDLPFIFFLIWFAGFDLFKWTHYPLRFNRKNRMVYVFRQDGTVLSVPWDKVHFNLGLGPVMPNGQIWDVRGHVLNKEGIIKETLVLGISTTDKTNTLGHWELVRRYMEEGPQAVAEGVRCCMPVGGKKEPFLKGYRRLFVVFEAMGRTFMIILFPILVPIYFFGFGVALGRGLAMRTSKIPQWPEEVLNACKIDKNDRYIKNNDTDPF